MSIDKMSIDNPPISPSQTVESGTLTPIFGSQNDHIPTTVDSICVYERHQCIIYLSKKWRIEVKHHHMANRAW
jgi:hypothetical protein